MYRSREAKFFIGGDTTVTKTIGIQPKVYQLGMENFENDLDSILDHLLSPSSQSTKAQALANGNEIYSLELDYSHTK